MCFNLGFYVGKTVRITLSEEYANQMFEVIVVAVSGPDCIVVTYGNTHLYLDESDIVGVEFLEDSSVVPDHLEGTDSGLVHPE